MCHGITWYHALCLHPNPAPLYHIACEKAFNTGEYCYGFESICIPMVGLCDQCPRAYREEIDGYLIPETGQVGEEFEFEMVEDELSQDGDLVDEQEFYSVIF